MAKKKTHDTGTADEPTEPVVGEVVEAPAEPVEQPTTAVAVTEQSTVLGPIIGGISTDVLKQALALQTEQRELIAKFIKDHLVDGTDYGRIHVVKCPNQYDCDKDYHFSKRVLFKPGQEKLFSLFQITDKLERDQETYEMLTGINGLVAYKCTLYRGEQVIGHGRGSATLGDKNRDANATIKIAEKRARMDACLSLGFSEYFAQDLDDPDYKAQAEMAQERARQEAERREQERLTQPMSDDERTLLAKWMSKRGFGDSTQMLEVLRLNGIADPTTITAGQAQEMIRKLSTNVFVAPSTQDEPQDVGTLDDTDILDLYAGKQQPSVDEAELVVDNDMQSDIHLRFTQCGLNQPGQMWFMKYITGRPYAKWEEFTDDHWRRAYKLIEDIEGGAVEVPDRYIKGLVTGSIKQPEQEAA